MAKIIKFPPHALCPCCSFKLRPATIDEINRGLASSDQQTQQIFMHAVQGDVSRKFTIDNKLSSILENDTPPGSWVLVCDSCGLKLAYSREEEPGSINL